MTFMQIMTSPLLYVLVAAGIVYILIFCAITLRRSYKHALDIGISREKLRTAITSSAIYSVVPSISIVIGLLSLSLAIGLPWSWFRLSVVGAVTYELMSAEMVAAGAGFATMDALNAAPNGAALTGTVMFVMSIGIMAGIVTVLLFGKKIQSSVTGMRSKHGAWGALMTGVLSLGIIEAFLPMQLMKGMVSVAVVLTSCVIVLIHMAIIKATGWKWMRNFVMADTLLLGMASSLLWLKVFGG